MTTIEASSEIKKFIEQTYEVEFKGKVEVVDLGEDTHVLRLILNSFYVPLNITVQGTMEEFLENVKDQIKKRRLNLVEYYSGYKNESGRNN